MSQITIKEITDRCGINRMTFYYHFRDIYDLADQAIREKFQEAVGEISCCGTSWQDWYIEMGHTVLKNQALVHNLISAVPYDMAVDYLYSLTKPILLKAIAACDPEGTVNDGDRNLIADFFKCAFVGTELSWVRSGMKESPEWCVRRLSALVQGMIPLALSNFSEEFQIKEDTNCNKH